MINIFKEFRNKLLMQLPVANARKAVRCAGKQAGNPAGPRQLLVDVSVIIQNDARTGIQRVVRAILSELATQLPYNYVLRPVFATKRHAYHYAGEYQQQLGLSDISNDSGPVKVLAGDIFFGLDLTAHILPRRSAQLERWKKSGVNIHVMVYDLLPLQSPEWFYKRTADNFQRWMRTIAIFADSFICISHTVRRDVKDLLTDKYNLSSADSPALHVVRLGSDIESTMPSKGIRTTDRQVLTQISDRTTILIVGTLEPRKGHKELLRAFERIWRGGHQINLVICGKAGWKTELLQQRITSHPENGKRLFWLDDATDDTLFALYQACYGVIVASFGEGFGLPLVEALRFNKPVLARDIPVFREIAGDQVHFFNAIDSKTMAVQILHWLELPKQNICQSFMTFSWHDTVKTLLTQLTHTNHLVPEHERQFQPLPRLPMLDGKL